MKATETKLKGCFVLEPTVFEDSRGYFFESYNENKMEEILGYKPTFVQDNQSNSTYGVVRGLHIQAGEHSQAKLVRVVEGAVIDVAVDVREGSETYGQSVAVELSANNKKQLFIPRGFLHGFSVLSQDAIVNIKIDRYFVAGESIGVRYDDKYLNIDWKIKKEDMILGEGDKNLKSFKEVKSPFMYDDNLYKTITKE